MAGTSYAEQARNAQELANGMRRLAEVIQAAADAGVDGTRDVANESVKRIKELLSRPYPPASRAGEPPAWRTGRLRRSYKVFTDTAGGVTFGSDVEYAPYLEFGTRRMRPRPHVRPVVKEMQVRATEVIAGAIIERQRQVARRHGGRG